VTDFSAISAFVDSDVIISSLISETGAAYYLLEKKVDLVDDLVFLWSNYSAEECKKVCKCLNLDIDLLFERTTFLRQVQLRNSLEEIQRQFAQYSLDKDDCHIVAGAVAAKVNFLITYNKKDYLIEQLKKDFSMIVFSPGEFLQYLRSL